MISYPTRITYKFYKSILIILIGMLFAYCGNTDAEVKKLFQKEQLPKEITKNAKIIFSDSGRVKAILLAPEIIQYEDQGGYADLPKGIHVTFFKPDGTIESTIVADWARQYIGDEVIEAKDNVVVESTDGKKLESPHLLWNARTHKIKSNSVVTLTTDGEKLYGTGLEADENLDNYIILNPVGSLNSENDLLE